MGGLISFFVKKSIFVNLIAVIVTLTGFFIYFKSPKEIFLIIELGIVVVNAVYPQAASVEVEKLVINPVEESIKNLKGVKELYSTRSESVSTMILQAEEANDPQIIEITSEEFWNYNDDFIRGNLWTNMESSKTVIESKTSKISGIGKIKKWGYFDKAIWVNARKDDLKKYNITIFGLMNVLKDRNIYMPAGNKKFGYTEYSLRLLYEQTTADPFLHPMALVFSCRVDFCNFCSVYNSCVYCYI